MNEITKFEEEKMVMSSMFGAVSTSSIVYGIMLIIISMFLFINPGQSYMLVTILLGVYLVVKGLIDFIAVFNSDNPQKGITLFDSVISFIAGFIVLSTTVFVMKFLVTFIVYIIGFSFILSGVIGFKKSILISLINIAIGILMFFFTESVAVGFVWLLAFLILLGGVFSITFGAMTRDIVRKIDNA